MDDQLAYLKNNPNFKLWEVKGKDPQIEAYGRLWPLASEFSIEITAYRINHNGQACTHLKNASFIAWPDHIETWNYWTERRFQAHCEGHHTITMAAGANTGKSVDAAKLAILFWLANPYGRTVLVASTSLTDLDSRIWGYVKRFYAVINAIPFPGQLFNSPPPKILLSRDDTVHGMFAVPLQRGTPGKTASTLIGRHPDEGFLAVIDEGTDVTAGFMEAVPNWEKSPIFQMIVIGNSCSKFDPHGLLSQPLTGWHTVDPDYDKEWPTKNGVCLYFDCYDSPAIYESDLKKKDALSKFLFTTESIEQAKVRYGETSPDFMRFTRGFWPREDTLQTILSAVMIDKFGVKQPAEWSGQDNLIQLAGLDPALTPDGDDCILRFATLGLATTGRWVLDFGGEENIHKLVISTENTDPAEYQILQQCMTLCRKYGVEPQNFALDVWGPGSGLGAIFATVWSNQVYQVSSAGYASDIPVTNEQDPSKIILGRDVYDRRITELWFSIRQFVQSNQIKGLDDLSCEQFCTREYIWKGKKYAIETKQDYKIRLGKVDSKYVSPDRADAACMIIDLVRRFYGFIPQGQVDIEVTIQNSLRRKFLEQRLADSEYARQVYGAESLDRSSHPNSWTDGFLNPYEQSHEDDY